MKSRGFEFAKITLPGALCEEISRIAEIEGRSFAEQTRVFLARAVTRKNTKSGAAIDFSDVGCDKGIAANMKATAYFSKKNAGFIPAGRAPRVFHRGNCTKSHVTA